MIAIRLDAPTKPASISSKKHTSWLLRCDYLRVRSRVQVQVWCCNGAALFSTFVTMSFAYPLFLWALSALAIPVIIHLFNFRKTIRIYFSNTRLLQQLSEETTKKQKLKQLLVLAARLLFLFFLVVAFAQPFLPAAFEGAKARNKIIYLDNSLSMSAPVAEKTRALDAAIQMAGQLLATFPPDTRFRLMTNDFAPFSNTFKSKVEVADALASVRLTPVFRSASDIASRIRSSAGSEDVFWISDFQQSTWGTDGFFLDSTRHWHLVQVPLQKTGNIFVDTLYLDRPFAAVNEANSVKVKLRNTGNTRVEGLVVKLTINQRQEATATLTVEPQGSVTTSFDLTGGWQGRNQAIVSFTDFPISFDNEFYFTLAERKPLRIVEIKGPAATPRIRAVYANPRLFSWVSYQVTNVDYSELPRADLVVLHELPRIEPSLLSALKAFQQRGGRLLLIPTRGGDVAPLRELFPTLPLTAAADGKPAELDKPDMRQPFFEYVFESESGPLLMPAATPSLRWGADAGALLRFKDQTPFLTRRGNSFLLASSLQDGDSDFARHALFVPTLYRLASIDRRAERAPYYTTRQQIITLPAEDESTQQPVRLVGKQEWIPAQTYENGRVMMELPALQIAPGFYHAWDGADTLGLLAFNPEKKESILAAWEPDAFQETYGNSASVSFLQTADAGAFGNEIKERYLGRPLWRQALLLALLFLLAEVLLIRFFK